MAMAVAAIHTKLGLRSLEARPKLWASAQHLEPFAFQEAVHINHINIQIYTLHTHIYIYINYHLFIFLATDCHCVSQFPDVYIHIYSISLFCVALRILGCH